MIKLHGSSVLVTGGTRGLGKATALEFAKAGAHVTVTHRWGSADETELCREFSALDLEAPHIIESDAGDPEAVRAALAEIRRSRGRLDAIISNVAVAKPIHATSELKRNTFELSLRYTCWPIVELTLGAMETFGRPPGYVVGISSLGAEVCPPGYDLAGSAKASLEMLCRYLAIRVKAFGTRVNVLRTGYLDTKSSRATFGDSAIQALADRGMIIDPRGPARACVALCSGMLDSVTGQVLVADEGWSLVDPIAYITGNGLPGPFPPQE
jgi:3-oxoacyl-[acyl-carrier protein] reductase